MAFKGTTVFLSRNLVPPEVFDSLHDALKLNGALVNLCCDPSRIAPNEYHIISSNLHEKFELLRGNGCNLVGPECIISCAKERRCLPKQAYTCCLALDGAKVLASGFDQEEKANIEKMVSAMAGLLVTKVSLDINFVIMKDVLASKYKWASCVLKKPILFQSWLNQCWVEHRAVPQEPYRVLPFVGLTICATGIPADERQMMQEHIKQNGGRYSPDLTKKCTHLVSEAPEGDKHRVAAKWGTIAIVNQKWLHESIIAKVCLEESLYPVRGAPSLQTKMHNQKCLQAKANTVSLSMTSIHTTCEDTLSQSMSTAFSEAVLLSEDLQSHSMPTADESKPAVATDSQAEGDDLYLAECRIFLAGFQLDEMRHLVKMVRQGGGSRYMNFNEKLTHIIVGCPSDVETREISQLAMWGVIHVVGRSWLEECHKDKKEIPVSLRHTIPEFYLNAGNQVKRPEQGSAPPLSVRGTDSEMRQSLEQQIGPPKPKQGPFEKLVGLKSTNSTVEEVFKSDHANKSSVAYDSKGELGPHSASTAGNDNNGGANVFKGKRFCFSKSFPEDRKQEIIDWIVDGRGVIIKDQIRNNVDFIVDCHGSYHGTNLSQATSVSTHWIRCSLEEGLMPDVRSHILYSPLPCRVPFPGFEKFRFCVSQYGSKDRLLLKNLCYVLGVKFSEKLNAKATHLLCKFTSGVKYDAASKWHIEPVTVDWIYECVRQDTVVPLDSFRPQAATAEDQEAGLSTMTQYPAQSTWKNEAEGSKDNVWLHEASDVRDSSKRLKKTESSENKDLHPSDENDALCFMMSRKTNPSKDLVEDVAGGASDVAAVIENLLAHSSEVIKSPGGTCHQTIFSSDCSILSQNQPDSTAPYGPSSHWSNRTERQDLQHNQNNEVKQAQYDGFSETQMESQVVEYEEDLTGRQMIIEKVRTQNLTPLTHSEKESDRINDNLGRLLRVAHVNKQ